MLNYKYYVQIKLDNKYSVETIIAKVRTVWLTW